MILEALNLSKNYGKKAVLKDINFSINRGEIIGLIGPNGSGKTTLLNLLMGLIKPTSGEITMQGDLRLGMSVSRKGFFDDMTVIKNIMLYTELLNAQESQGQELVTRFLIDYGQVRYGKLSAGMKQRVSLIASFVGKPNLIFLDEPSNHLDIDSILILREMILGLKQSGISFLITSHIFSDLEKVCDRILFLKNGMVMKNSSTTELVQTYGNLEDAYLNIFKNKDL